MNRIRELRKNMGISMREAASRLNLPYTTYVNYEKGDREPNSEVLIAIADLYQTSVDFLICRSFAEQSLSPDKLSTHGNFTAPEIKMVKKYRTLDKYGKEIIDTNLEIEYRRMQQLAKPKLTEINLLSDPPEEEAHIIYLPEPLQPASAGTGDFADDDTAEEVPVLYNASTAKADYIMRVHGDSMKPDIQDGDRLLVRRQPAVDIGETGIFIHEGERFVKIFQGDCLKSANTDYKDIPVSEYTICIGKVIDVLDPDWIVK